MTDYVAAANEYFCRGYSCAQAVLLAFAQPVGLEEEQALMLASSFGAGMGRMREVCGALSALLMIDGLLEGYTSPDDVQGKAEHYGRVQELAGRFRDEMGSILCRELLENPATSPVPEARTPEYYAARPCNRAVVFAAKMGSELLKAKKFQKY